MKINLIVTIIMYVCISSKFHCFLPIKNINKRKLKSYAQGTHFHQEEFYQLSRLSLADNM